MVVRNPYAKKRPRPPESVDTDTARLRLLHPPPSNRNVGVGSVIGPSNKKIVSIASTKDPPSQSADTVAANIPSRTSPALDARISFPAKETSTTTAHANLDLSFDDGGIDWTAAVLQMEQTVPQLFHPSPAISTAQLQQEKQQQPHSIQMTLSQSKQPGNSTLRLERPQEWTNPSTNLAVTNPQHQPSSTRPQSSAATSTAQTSIPRILQYDRERTKPVEDDLRSTLVQNARLAQPLQNGWRIYSHQKKAILQALLMRRMILALDMGLGKTLIGCVWARAFQATYGGETLKVICICPVSLMRQWKRTAEEATGIVVEDIGKNKPDPESSWMQICSWAKIPERISSRKYVVICDEAHSMQSLEAGRTKAVLQLCKSSRCVGVLLLTGTPMKNGKPANLFPLLRAVKHPFGDNQKAYERHFCDGREKPFGRGRVVWDANGCSNLSQLKEHISSHLLHMTKESCLGDLPPQTRVYKHVTVSSKHQLQHNQALNELATIYASTGKLEHAGDAILTAVTRVRQIGSYAKIDATVAIVKDVLQEESAVVVFTSFAKVAKEVHRKLADSGWLGELLTGETPANKRQGMVDNFQQGLAPVFVSTFGAGGVGLTLTAAHTIILLDRPWTPGEARQAEDRVRRIGQTKPVTCIWMVAFDLDKQIDQILEQKTNTTNAVLADGDAENQVSAPKISIFQLLKSVLTKAPPTQQTNTLLHYGFSQDETAMA